MKNILSVRNTLVATLAFLMLAGCSQKEGNVESNKKKREFKRMPEITLTDAQKGQLQLFILAGQSNMSGRGDINNKNVYNTADPRIVMFGNDHKWRQALEPVDNPVDQIDKVSRDNNAGYGPAMSFGKTLADKLPDATIGIIPCARGASTIMQCQKSRNSNSLYRDCIEKLKKPIPDGKH